MEPARLALTHGAYFLATGAWPLVHLRSFTYLLDAMAQAGFTLAWTRIAMPPETRDIDPDRG